LNQFIVHFTASLYVTPSTSYYIAIRCPRSKQLDPRCRHITTLVSHSFPSHGG